MNNTLTSETKNLLNRIELEKKYFDNLFLVLNMSYKPEKNILDLVGEELFDESYNYKAHRI